VGYLSMPIILLIVTSITPAYSQIEDPIVSNNFTDDMGIWTTSQSAQLVKVTPSSDDSWLILQNGIGNSGVNPSITSKAIYLKDYCSVQLTFDMLALNSDASELVYVQVSSDGGKSFQFLRESSENILLSNDSGYNSGERQNLKFPVRGFLTDSIMLKIGTHNLRDNSKVYLDNIKLESVDDEDYLLAHWQMGDQSSSDMATKITPQFESGNCGGIYAYPVEFSNNTEHFGIEGYNYGSVASSNPASAQSDGGLCIDFNDPADTSSLSFVIKMSPEDKGRISGFEFMEHAPLYIDGMVG